MSLSRISRLAAGAALAVVLSVSLLGVWTQATTTLKSDFRSAASYVTTHRQGNAPIMFQMPYVHDTFDYYFGGEYVALEGPWTNDGRSETDVEEGQTRTLEAYSEVWLVASESWLWDSRDLTRSWFDQHAHLIDSASFALVDVYHYDLQIDQ